MHDLLPAWPLLIAFVAASAVLAVTPGPGVMYIVTRSLAQGRAAGLASVGGVALLNPKTALFFAAFLPQFMSGGAHPMAQSVLLGMLFVLTAVLTDTAWVLVAGALAPALGRLQRARKTGRYVAGGTFIGLGFLTAIAGERHR